MSESTHLLTLKKALAQCEEALSEISDRKDVQILSDHILLLKMDIRRMEDWAKQDKVRTQNCNMECGEK